MKTDDLLTALAADTAPRLSSGDRMRRALPVGFGLSVAALLLLWGVRPDLLAALSSLAVVKTMAPLVIAALAAALALHLSRPETGGGIGRWRGVVLTGVAIIALVFGSAIAVNGVSGFVATLWVPSLAVCFLSIPVLSLPLLAAALWGLSAGAPLNSSKTGLVAGVAAGGLATAIYTFYCDQDSVLFYIPAYSAAIGLVALMGAVAGARVLRW
jgi:hypothetical protein